MLFRSTEMIEINGPALSQWDVGRSVKITGIDAEYAHFANKGDAKAVVVGVVDIDAKIPDYLLQTGKQLCVHVVKDGITVESKTFSVKNRERPENYVYEDDQRNYIYELITNAEHAIEDAIMAAHDADTSAGLAKLAAENANKAVDGVNKSADSAIQAAKNANEAAVKAANTAKSLMVVGKVAGASIQLDDAIDQFLVGLRIFGKTTQDGTPTPDAPVDLVSVGDKGSIAVNVTGKTNAMSMIIATPNGLPGIPVTSGGNYVDSDGQQWVCDEIDFARGAYITRVKKITINGSSTEKWNISSVQYVEGAIRFDLNMQTEPRAGRIYCMCDTYTATNVANFGAETCWCSSEEAAEFLRFRICTAYASTVDEIKSFLQSKPVTFIYQLATPIETPLPEEELAAYAALHTYKDRTTVSNDAGAYMELEYVMDAKKYIDSLVGSAGGGSSAGIVDATVE